MDLFNKKMQLCSLVLDNFYGVSTAEWLQQHGYPEMEELNEEKIDLIIEEIKQHETQTAKT